MTWKEVRPMVALVIVGITSSVIVITVMLGILEQFGIRTLSIVVWVLLFSWALSVVWDVSK